MKNYEFTLHVTKSQDASDIREVETCAFGFAKEADLVDDLLIDETAFPTLSLMAKHNGKAVGHILFTRVTFQGNSASPLMHLLAPLAVIPEYQGFGVGGFLINHGIRQLKEIGCLRVFVLGHAGYYPRHGFEPDAGSKGYHAPYFIPEHLKDCWMTQGLSANPFNAKGNIQCAQALMRPEHWRE